MLIYIFNFTFKLDTITKFNLKPLLLLNTDTYSNTYFDTYYKYIISNLRSWPEFCILFGPLGEVIWCWIYYSYILLLVDSLFIAPSHMILLDIESPNTELSKCKNFLFWKYCQLTASPQTSWINHNHPLTGHIYIIYKSSYNNLKRELRILNKLRDIQRSPEHPRLLFKVVKVI